MREAMCWVFIVLTVGILRLIFYWRPDWMLKCICVVESLDKAQYVFIEVWSSFTCIFLVVFPNKLSLIIIIQGSLL